MLYYMKNDNVDGAARKRILASVVNKLKKKYGENVLLDPSAKTNYDVIPSGSMLFDKDSGIGGIARGKVVEIYGDEASGKTTLASCLCANAQEKYPNDMVLFVDIEHALDLDYMRAFGVDTNPDRFMLAQPDSIEEALTIMEDMCETGIFSLIVLDSVGAALTLDQLEKGMDENTMGSLAKRMSVGTNKIKTVASDTNTAIVFINQTYASMSMYGGNVTKGGKALRYVASMRIQVSKKDLIASVDDKEEVVGQGLAYKFIKNKLAPPYKKGETLLYFGKGFDKFTEIIDLSIEFGLIKQGGPWYTFNSVEGEEIKFQGKERVKDFLKNSDKDFKFYEKSVRDILENKDQAGNLTEEEIAAIEAQEALDAIEITKETGSPAKTTKTYKK